MLTSIVKKIKIIPSYLYRNYAAPQIYSIRDRKILSKNLELKDKYSGQRCFLIGAGPSIATTDLSKLKNEYTFVVNEFEKTSQHKVLSPSFHIISESNYYIEGGPEYWLNRFKEESDIISVETTMIINLRAIPFMEKHGLFQKHNVYYVGTQGIFSEKLPFNIGLNKYIPNPKNSILLCLVAAIWMGFNEIYLLGCEHSFLARPLDKKRGLSWRATHNLNDIGDEALKKYLDPKSIALNYEASMADVLQLFRNYRLLYAKARNINPELKIYNATPNSFLDVFPMINFENIRF